MMFQQVQPAPPDAILGLNEAFQADTHPNKINLSVGQYKDNQGATPILDCVKQAEHQLLAEESSKGYLGIVGDPNYDRLVPQLLLGEGHRLISARRVTTAQTPGGTGALRVAADFIKQTLPADIWLSEPTWPNHPNIFMAAGLAIHTYPYFDPATSGLNFEGLLTAVNNIPAGDFVVLHGCCHNPTGIDLTAAQWRQVAEVLRERQLIPLVDFAYQGFGDGLHEDAVGLRTLCEHVDQALICSSFSKNFGLYGERVGALTLVGDSPDITAAVTSRIKKSIRANYSNPPAHGAKIVAKILADGQLRELWTSELEGMRKRIALLRQSFVNTMRQLNSPIDFSFITAQRGMFSFSGLTPEQVERLQEEHSIYIVRNGRINVAGMRDDEVPTVCQAILSVIG